MLKPCSRKNETLLLECPCHEGNYGMEGEFSGTRPIGKNGLSIGPYQ